MRRVVRAICAATIIGAPVGAKAADIALAPVVPAAAWSWTGVYVGFHLASGWADNVWKDAADPLPVPFVTGSGSGNGAVGGGQVGLNYQIGPWVVGGEVAGSAADINTLTVCGNFACTGNIDALATATGRFGFAFDQFLLYGKAGAAMDHAHVQLEGLPSVSRPIAGIFRGNPTRWGWTAGAGVEFAFSPALSAFVEYDFLDFGSRGIAVTDQDGIGARLSVAEQVQLVKVGLNYKLGQPFSPWAAHATTAAVLPPADPARWSGIYVGGHVGGGWGRTNWNSATGLFSDGTSIFAGSGPSNGFELGGQLGANYQIGAWVVGAEAEAGWSDLDGNTKCAVSMPTGYTCHTRINGLGTFTGRLGQAFGNLLVYGKGGAAWDSEEHFAFNNARTVSVFSGDAFRWGWTVGAGLEYAFTPAWSGKVEYNYMSFADAHTQLRGDAGNTSNVGFSQSINVVKMGFNYKLGADPLAGAAATPTVPLWVKAPVFKAPPPSDWTIEAGARYWLSSGRKQLDLSGGAANLFFSRLTFEGVTGQSAESFARLDHRNGTFLKGRFGLGDLVRGRFFDEDPGPGTVPYSNTLSAQHDGRTLYGSLDAGHALIRGPSGDLGAYLGYRYLYERNNSFGIKQLATSPIGVPSTNEPVTGLSETEAWNGVAVGLNARITPAERWQLEIDAALLPFIGVWNTDNHWLSADRNPLPAAGEGWGSQFEAILSYAVTDQWSVGVGGRYWYFATSSAFSIAQPIKLYSERYGGFLQASYKFDGAPRSARALYSPPAAPVTWTGVYAGLNIGAGFGRAAWSDPFGPTSIGDQNLVGGALVGGQVGANYQVGSIVYGIEAAGNWAPLNGTASCFAGNPNQGINAQDCGTRVGALAFLTSRVGYALDRTLYYVKAGPAFGHSTFDLNFTGAAPAQVSAADVDRFGFTVGAGVEHALTREWSIVGEYKYVDLGSASVHFGNVPPSVAPIAMESINQRYQAVTLGLNYKLF
jgi:opacity protein-like surface antigen